jgi:transposase
MALLPLLEVLEHLTSQVRGFDKKIEDLSKLEYPQTDVLRRVRGVGPLVALAYVVTIGDPKRFEDSRNVGAYLGLVPRSYQSGASDPHLRISKQGDRMLRTLLVNAATHIMRRSSPDSSLKRLGKRIANRGNPRDRARARVAVARKLAVILHHLLRTGEVYEPLRGATV